MHRIFSCGSNWKRFAVAQKNQDFWLRNQYSDNWTDIVNGTFETLVVGNKPQIPRKRYNTEEEIYPNFSTIRWQFKRAVETKTTKNILIK